MPVHQRNASAWGVDKYRTILDLEGKIGVFFFFLVNRKGRSITKVWLTNRHLGIMLSIIFWRGFRYCIHIVTLEILGNIYECHMI